MKKNLLLLAAILCCAMTTTVFTACGDDDDDITPAELKVVGFQVNYSLSFPETFYSSSAKAECGNLYLLFDKVEVGYLNENGEEQREVVNNGKWSKTVTYNKSTHGYIKLYLTKPANLNVESLPYEKYDQGVVYRPLTMDDFTIIYNDGTKRTPTLGDPFQLSTPSSSFAVSKAKLQEYLSIFKDELKIMSFSFEI